MFVVIWARGGHGPAASIVRRMELLPKYLVVGMITPPPGVPGGYEPTPDALTRIWSEVGPRHGYRRFELSPDGAAVQIFGARDDDGISVQPPLIQVRGNIQMTAQTEADRAQAIIKVVAEQLGIRQFFNLGIRHLYHAPAPGRDARAFVMNKLLSRTDEDVAALRRGGSLWSGVKYVVSEPEAQYTLLVEPLVADNTYVFLDLDAQFPGEARVEDIRERASDAERYLTQTVSSYLDGLATG
jgi:hypothetical protein